MIILCGVIRDKFIGIYNGLDDTLWDPALDSALPETYSLEKMAGKSTCKAMLRQELGLPMDLDNSVPLVRTFYSHISVMPLNFIYWTTFVMRGLYSCQIFC